MVTIGTKFYKYEEDNLLTYRLLNFKDGEYKLKILSGGKGRVSVNEETLNTHYVRLNPDAFLNMMTTVVHDKTGDIKDVFACVNKATDMLNGKQVPALILRQNCMSDSKNAFARNMDIYVGDCFREDTIQDNMKMEDLMEFDEIIKSHSISLYVDDTIGDIFECIPGNVKKEFEDTLKAIKSANTNKLIKGYVATLNELFDENNFLLNYRALFNIMQVDFPIYIGEKSYDAEDNIILNKKQHKRLEDALSQHIKVIAVLKYDKDIDISRIVSFTHIMVSDKSGIIYLIAFQKISDYKIDDDIANALGIQQ